LGIKPTPILEVCLARAGLEILSQKFCCGRNLYYQTATYQDMQHNREPTLSPGVRGESRPAARDQEKKIANAIQAGESKAQRP
jgi:hypothetical protein